MELLKTAAATAKKNKLQHFKNIFNNNNVVDFSILADMAPEVAAGIENYCIKDLSSGCCEVFYFGDISNFEHFSGIGFFKRCRVYDKNTYKLLYDVFKLVKIEHNQHTRKNTWVSFDVETTTKKAGFDLPEEMEI